MIVRQFGSVPPAPSTRGVVFVHSTPAPLCPHIEWAIGAALGAPQHIDWTNQPAERGALRMELSWLGTSGTGADIASRLLAMERLRFEVVEEPSLAFEGHRYAFTPSLGLFTAIIDPHGEVMVSEERLKKAIADSDVGTRALRDSVAALLGDDWDSELDIFRHASEDAPVRWLHQVV